MTWSAVKAKDFTIRGKKHVSGVGARYQEQQRRLRGVPEARSLHLQGQHNGQPCGGVGDGGARESYCNLERRPHSAAYTGCVLDG